MSNFLKNIIARHSVRELGFESNHIVEPRLRSRFETGSGTGPFPSRHSPGVNPVAVSAGEEFSRSRHVTPRFPGDGHGEHQSPGSSTAEPGGRISTWAENSELGLMARETPADGIQYKSSHGTNVQTGMTRYAEPQNNQHLSVSNQLDHRIQTILQRLDGMQTKTTGRQVSGLPGNGITPSNAANGSLAALEGFPPISEPFSEIEHAGKPGPQSIKNRAMSPETHQSGLFQTPAWVAEIRSGLQNRFRETASPTLSEPIVNVTIGRVEIRAVKEEVQKQSKTSNKPGSIMSLDDYLEQRNGRQL